MNIYDLLMLRDQVFSRILRSDPGFARILRAPPSNGFDRVIKSPGNSGFSRISRDRASKTDQYIRLGRSMRSMDQWNDSMRRIRKPANICKFGTYYR